MNSYDGNNCSVEEFEEDLSIITSISKQFGKYKNTDNFNVRLTLNYFITFYNIFHINATRLLFWKIPEDKWSLLKTFLVFLNFMPEYVFVNNRYIYTEEIMIDDFILRLIHQEIEK